jgi:hypothetical protein
VWYGAGVGYSLMEQPVQCQQAEGKPLNAEQLQVGDGRQPVRGKGKSQPGQKGSLAPVRPVEDKQIHPQPGQGEAEQQAQIIGDDRLAADESQGQNQRTGRKQVFRVSQGMGQRIEDVGVE